MNSENNSPSKKDGLLDPKANLKALFRVIVILFILGGGTWLYLRYKYGGKVTAAVVSAVLRQPMELKNAIENLPAASYKGLPIYLPYPGTVTIEINVKHGNDIDIYLISEEQMKAMNIRGEIFPPSAYLTSKEQTNGTGKGGPAKKGNSQKTKMAEKAQFVSFTNFNAQKTRSYRRSGHLGVGTYYILLFDPTLGVISETTSDVEVHANLEP